MYKKQLNCYFMLHNYGQYGKEIEIRAKNIFEAIKKGTEIMKKKMLNKGFIEEDGVDIALRIWRYWK